MDWVSVEDRLPPTGFMPLELCSLNVLLYDPENDDACEGWFCYLGADIRWNSYAYGEDIKPTHWMLLPAPPVDKPELPK